MENIKNAHITSVWLNNEALFKNKTNTEPFVTKKIKEAVKSMRAYGFKNNWLVYSNKTCPRCKAAIKKEQLGKGKCVSYFCYNCQLLFRK
jgi:hypothetical protein